METINLIISIIFIIAALVLSTKKSKEEDASEIAIAAFGWSFAAFIGLAVGQIAYYFNFISTEINVTPIEVLEAMSFMYLVVYFVPMFRFKKDK